MPKGWIEGSQRLKKAVGSKEKAEQLIDKQINRIKEGKIRKKQGEFIILQKSCIANTATREYQGRNKGESTMNAKDLYEDNIYGNGNPTYYEDEECKKTYTGHVESFYNGKLEEEFDVVDGLRNGIQKEYENGILTEIDETRGNKISGFGVAYYPSGAFKAISITYKDNLISAYFYSEDGRVVDKSEVLERDLDILKTNPDGIFALVSIADLEKMNEEILKYGHPLNLPKGFEFVVPEK